MQLFVRAVNLHTVNVTGTETVADVKRQVAVLDDLSAADLAIYCCGRPLADDEAVSSFAELQATLDVEVRLLGGIVGIMYRFVLIHSHVSWFRDI